MVWVIGLDVGNIRVGVAVGDSGTGIVSPVGTFSRAGGKAERELLRLIDERSVRTVVAGLPLSESGRETEQCKSVRRFCTRLTRRAKIVIEYIDEYASSCEAREMLDSAGRGRQAQQKGVLDTVSASILLQEYLDRIRCS